MEIVDNLIKKKDVVVKIICIIKYYYDYKRKKNIICIYKRIFIFKVIVGCVLKL